MTEINKEFIESVIKMVDDKDLLTIQLNNKFKEILPRVEKMTDGHIRAIKELRVDDENAAFEFDGKDDHYDRRIKEIFDHETYFSAHVELVERGFQEWEEERVMSSYEIDIPYNQEDDEDYIEKFKSEKKQKLTEQKKNSLEDAKKRYLDLKNKFEGE